MLRALILVLAASAAPAAAQDSRNVALENRTAALGWAAVGRLEMGDAYCSGALIASDLVLTAAHCLYDSAGQPRSADDISFRAGLVAGKPLAARGARVAVPHPDWHPDRRSFAMNGVDLALVRLDGRMPSDLAPPFATTRIGRGDTLSVVSYGRGRDMSPSWQRRCKPLGAQSGTIVVSCDATFGTSGAPIFVEGPRRVRIAGVAVAIARTDRGQVTLAADPVAEMATLRAALSRAERGQASGGGAKFLSADDS